MATQDNAHPTHNDRIHLSMVVLVLGDHYCGYLKTEPSKSVRQLSLCNAGLFSPITQQALPVGKRHVVPPY
ncbi:hypothetical protein P4H71_26040 [Paenibacillus kribbensis]|uniref:hypothetical protein n=1 Tax=Paenibacillus kribbensis TaxID=172713 RepID=UPI002DBCA87A|nr:hypothetical protein [Paenibacillus kribbensis]MEC0237782.1 hypothetical protein [Paenibacillus kribbensis]